MYRLNIIMCWVRMRDHFEVDAHHVVVAALHVLAQEGIVDKKVVAEAIAKYGIDPERLNPLYA